MLVGPLEGRLGGSEYLAQFGGSDRFPELPEEPATLIATLAAVADAEGTRAVHGVSHGGLAVSLAEMVSPAAGLEVSLPADGEPIRTLFAETPGRALVQTTDPDRVEAAFEGVAPVSRIGAGTDDGRLAIAVDDRELTADAAEIRALRSTIETALE